MQKKPIPEYTLNNGCKSYKEGFCTNPWPFGKVECSIREKKRCDVYEAEENI